MCLMRTLREVYEWLRVPTTANHSLTRTLRMPYVHLRAPFACLCAPYVHLTCALRAPYACLMCA